MRPSRGSRVAGCVHRNRHRKMVFWKASELELERDTKVAKMQIRVERTDGRKAVTRKEAKGKGKVARETTEHVGLVLKTGHIAGCCRLGGNTNCLPLMKVTVTSNKGTGGMESSVVLFLPRIHLFACTHPSVSNTLDVRPCLCTSISLQPFVQTRLNVDPCCIQA